MKLSGQKIKAGALQLVVSIALVLFLLIGIFLLRKGFTSHLLSVVAIEKQLQLNVESATAVIGQYKFESMQDSIVTTLFPEINDQTKITFKPWGVYDVGIISTQIQKRTFKKIFLFGAKKTKISAYPSLYLADPNRYLSLGGCTYLGDNTFLPGYGVRKGYINGIGYMRDRLVFGESKRAGHNLPKLSDKVTRRYQELVLKKELPSGFEYATNTQKTLKQSFFLNTMLVEEDDDIDLHGCSITGNIIIRSGGKVVIDSTSTIDQAVVIGKEIEINNGFKGRGQFLASKMIQVGERSQLKMPSALVLLDYTGEGSILLKDQVDFIGDIVFYSRSNNLVPALKIGKKNHMVGQVYCDGYCDFEGVLFGSLYTKGFVSITPNSFNQNFLLNACIDVERKPDEFVGAGVTEDEIELAKIDVLF